MVVPTTVTVAQVTRAKTKLVAMKSLRIVIPQSFIADSLCQTTRAADFGSCFWFSAVSVDGNDRATSPGFTFYRFYFATTL